MTKLRPTRGPGQFLAEEDVPEVWQPGDVLLDLYEVRELLGEGGTGRVYRVHHRGWDVDLAVKSLRPDALARPGAVANFEREAEAWVRLPPHPHVVCCHYVRRLGGLPRVFAECLDGGTLADAIRTRTLCDGGPDAALRRILDIAIQLAWGLHHAHEQGLIHQDVKPPNVLLTADGTAKVTDFGIARARAAAGESAAREPGQSILVSAGGLTPAYCSPEQALGLALSRRSDVWNWAVTVLECFAGGVTWPAGQVADAALEAMAETSTRDAHLPTMPGPLVALLRRCLRQRPEERPRDMLEVADALRDLFATSTGETYLRPTPHPAAVLADGLNNRAVSLLDLGRRDEAVRLWEQALAVDRLHPQATYNLGRARAFPAAAGDDVIRRMQEVAAAHADDPTPRELLAQLRRERGEPEADRRFLRRSHGHDRAVTSVCVTPDLRHAVSGSLDGTLRLWDVATGRCLRTFIGHTAGVTALSLSRDGREVLSGSNDTTARLWDFTTGKCLRTFTGHAGEVAAVCHVAGDRILTACTNEPFRLWDAQGQRVRNFEHWGAANSACSGPDRTLMLSAAEHQPARLWEIATGRVRQTFTAEARVTALSLSRDSRYALTAHDDGTLRLWEATSGVCVRVCETGGRINSVCLGRDGRLALVGGEDGSLQLWEPAGNRCRHTFANGPRRVTALCLSPDGRLALSGHGDRTLALWEVVCESAAPFALARVGAGLRVHETEQQYCTALRAARDRLEAGRVTEAAERVRAARSLPGCRRRPEAFAAWTALYWHLPRTDLAAVWEATAAPEQRERIEAGCVAADRLHRFTPQLPGAFAMLERVRDRRVLFSGSPVELLLEGHHALTIEDDTVRVCEPGGHRTRHILAGHCGDVRVVAASADGRLVATGGDDGTVRLWEPHTGRCVQVLKGHHGSVASVLLSGDGRHLLTGGEDGTLRLWDVQTGRLVRTLSGHGDAVRVVALSRDAHQALSAEYAGTVRLWQTADGRCLHTFESGLFGVTWVGLSADARWAVARSKDGAAVVWELDWELR